MNVWSVVFLQDRWKHTRPSCLIKSDPVVYHIFERPDETFHDNGVCSCDDVIDAFILKNIDTTV